MTMIDENKLWLDAYLAALAGGASSEMGEDTVLESAGILANGAVEDFELKFPGSILYHNRPRKGDPR